MSQIKLKHSGGNSSIIAAPSSNPASDVTFRLPNADGSANQRLITDGSGNLSFVSAAAGGKILQVQSTLITDVKSTTSASFSDISGFNVNITPSSASSKVFVQISMRITGESNEAYLQLVRSVGGSDTAIGNGTGGNHDAFQSVFIRTGSNGYYDYVNTSFAMLDSPNTTSAITYKLQWRLLQGQTLYLGRTGYSTTAANYSGSSSNTITVMEVAA